MSVLQYPKVYLSAIKVLLSIYELKSPSSPNKRAIARTTNDRYNNYPWYIYIASVGCSWSIYLLQLYQNVNETKDKPHSLFLSKKEIYGFYIAGLGHFIRIWAKYTMHRHFTYTVHILKDHKLIQNGPYSIVRHPGYVGDVLLWIGEYLITNSYLLFLANFMNVQGSLQRIPVEDELLRQEFGDEYEDYRQKVRYSLIPYLI